jgi:hypothetical protein
MEEPSYTQYPFSCEFSRQLNNAMHTIRCLFRFSTLHFQIHAKSTKIQQ